MRAQKSAPPAPPSRLERELAASIHEAQQRKVPQSAPAPQPGPVAVPPATALPDWAARLVGKTDALIDAYAACLEHADAHGNRVRPEDVRSLLQTVYIAMTRANGASNAA
jgi:hypothetical protein